MKTATKTKTGRELYNLAQTLNEKYQGIDTIAKHCLAAKPIVEKIRLRKSSPFNVFPSVGEWLKDKIRLKLENIARNLPGMGYAMGSKYIVTAGRNKTISASYDNREEYPRGCKYSATHGEVNVQIPNLLDVLHFSVIGGVVTYIFPGQKSKLKKCWWYESKGTKQYYQLTKVSGWIYGNYHSTDKADCLVKGKERVKANKEWAKERERRAKYALQLDKKVKRATNQLYSFADSINAGNCEVGTRAFIMKHKLNQNNRYKGSFLLKLAGENSEFVLRMISIRANTL